jgi:hypothetical protein
LEAAPYLMRAILFSLLFLGNCSYKQLAILAGYKSSLSIRSTINEAIEKGYIEKHRFGKMVAFSLAPKGATYILGVIKKAGF